MRPTHVVFHLLLSLFLGSTVFFFGVKPFLATAIENTTPLITVPQSVEMKLENTSHKIHVQAENKDFLLGAEEFTNADPDLGNRYIVWATQFDTSWQIMAYDLRSKETLQLTHTFTNVRPVTDGEYIVWESQKVGETWKIIVFDGASFSEITDGKVPIQNTKIEDTIVTFSEMTEDGTGWNQYTYNVQTKRKSLVLSQ